MIQSLVYMVATAEQLIEQQISREPFASIQPVTEIFMHGYVERPVIGPSLPDENTMFVADAAIALIRAGKAQRLRMATKCDGNDPEKQLAVAKRTEQYIRAKLGPAFENFEIISDPVADTTNQEVRHFRDVLEHSATPENPETFMVLALDPHLKRIKAVMNSILGKEMTSQLAFYGGGEIHRLSDDPAEQAYAEMQLHSPGLRAFAVREVFVYRPLSRLPVVGIPLMDELNNLQGDGKGLATVVYDVAEKAVQLTEKLQSTTAGLLRRTHAN